jgi:hypothetical protein
VLRSGETSGTLYLDFLGWSGAANTTFHRPQSSSLPWPGPQMWRDAWVNAVDQWEKWHGDSFRIIQNEGRGLITTGAREWTDSRVPATIRPALIKSGGLAVRVQGLTRLYALQLTEQKTARLLKACEGQETVLAEVPFDWDFWQSYEFQLEARGNHLVGKIDGVTLEATDTDQPFLEGSIGLVVEVGHMMANAVRVE